jgi:hypothetical protein
VLGLSYRTTAPERREAAAPVRAAGVAAATLRRRARIKPSAARFAAVRRRAGSTARFTLRRRGRSKVSRQWTLDAGPWREDRRFGGGNRGRHGPAPPTVDHDRSGAPPAHGVPPFHRGGRSVTIGSARTTVPDAVHGSRTPITASRTGSRSSSRAAESGLIDNRRAIRPRQGSKRADHRDHPDGPAAVIARPASSRTAGASANPRLTLRRRARFRLPGARLAAAARRASRSTPRAQCAGVSSVGCWLKWLKARFSSTAMIAQALMPDSKILCSQSGSWL